jgi:hypothetical protein
MVLMGAGGFLLARTVCAEDLTEQEAVESARQSLDGSADFPWYDAANDRLQRIDVKPPKDLENRDSRWESKPPSWSLPGWLWRLLELLGWIILIAVMAVLVVFLVRSFLWDEERIALTSETEDAARNSGDIDRVDSLPFQLKRPQADLLSEARRHYESGDYGQAIIYLYSYQLVQLDRYQIIRLTKGKTNRQYLREVRPQPDLFALLEGTMVAFEDVFFGRHRLERHRFESCWQRMDSFHQQLEQVTA